MVDKIEVSKAEWENFFAMKQWRRILREFFDIIEFNRDKLEELRGEEALICQAETKAIRWLISDMPESLINEGEIEYDRRNKGDSGATGRNLAIPGRSH
jgi:hypothetical protein